MTTGRQISSAVWQSLQKRLVGDRLRVYRAFETHGPCTTEALSTLIPMSILSVRPRTTELLQAGLVEIDEEASHEARCGSYRAVPLSLVRERAEALAARPAQLSFGGLNV